MKSELFPLLQPPSKLKGFDAVFSGNVAQFMSCSIVNPINYVLIAHFPGASSFFSLLNVQ